MASLETLSSTSFVGSQEIVGGIGTQEEVDQLNKALNPGGAQYTGTPDSITGGSVFMTESLEPTLKVVSEIEKHVKLFNMIDKSRAFQLVEEYDSQSAFGGNGSAWMVESDDAPREEDATYSRQYEIVKYLGVKKRIHHVMTQIRSGHGDIIAKETSNGVRYLLKQIERNLFEGNGFFNNAGAMDGSVDLSSSFAFNGLDKQIRAGFANNKLKAQDFNGYGDDLNNLVDEDEAVMSPESIEELCRLVIEDFGEPSHLFLSPKAHSDFSRQYYPKERFNDGKGNITPGTVVPQINTCAGIINLVNSRFLSAKQKCRTVSAADNSSCASAPASVVSTDTNAASTDLEAGSYIYRVTSMTKDGESMPAVSAPIAALAGDRINIAIADPAAGISPFGFAVYRSEKDGAASSCKFVGFVKRSGAVTQFIDLNNKKPGTSQAYLMSMMPEVITLRQLTPMLKIDFYTIGLYRHWAQVFYGTPVIFKPNMCGIIENIAE